MHKLNGNLLKPDELTPFTDKNHSIKSLFILRPDNLGDFILFCGTLRHIRNRFPNAKITLCTKNYVYNLIEHCPYIDRWVSWDDMVEPLSSKIPWFRGRWRLEALKKWLKMNRVAKLTHRADLLLVPVRSPIQDMHLFSKSSPSKWKYGIEGDYNGITPEVDQHYNSEYTARLQLDESQRMDHELKVHQKFLEFIGIRVNPDELWPEVWTQKDDVEWAQKSIKKSNGDIHLAIGPGVTSISDKFYDAENYRKAISALGEVKLSISIFGSSSEKSQCDQVLKVLKSCTQVVSIENFAGKSTVRQLAEALKKCDLLLANETGSLHLATALRIPTVGIVGGGHFGRFYPWGDPNINLTANHPMDCYYCNWNCIYPSIKCIHEIAPELITKQLQSLIFRQLSERSGIQPVQKKSED